MVRLNVKKITETFDKALNIKFQAAPSVSRKAQSYRHGKFEIIINSTRVVLRKHTSDGNFEDRSLFEAETVKTTKAAVAIIYYGYFVLTIDRLDIKKVIGELENKLEFQFDNSNDEIAVFADSNGSFVIEHSKVPWSAYYLDLNSHSSSHVVLTANDVKSADDAVGRLTESLCMNFNRFKAQMREQKINEIFMD